MTCQTVWINRSAQPSLSFLAEIRAESVLVIGADANVASQVGGVLPYADIRWVDVDSSGDYTGYDLVIRATDPTLVRHPMVWRTLTQAVATVVALFVALGFSSLSFREGAWTPGTQTTNRSH